MGNLILNILTLGLPPAYRAIVKWRARRRAEKEAERKESIQQMQNAADAQAASRPMAESASVQSGHDRIQGEEELRNASRKASIGAKLAAQKEREKRRSSK